MKYEIKAERLYEIIELQKELITKLTRMVDTRQDYDEDYDKMLAELQELKSYIDETQD